MHNPYDTIECTILRVKDQAEGIKSFDFKLKSGKVLDYEPGQFYVFSLPGYGESVFVPMEKIGERNVYDIAVQKIGRVTSQFHTLRSGDTFGIRGPYGNGWDMKRIKNKDLLLIAGGIGLVPIRCLINYMLNRTMLDTKKQKVQLLYGCRSFGLMLYKDELKKWSKQFDIQISLDKGDHPSHTGMNCYKGVLGVLFKKTEIVKEGVAVLCGPPIIYKFIVPEVIKLGFPDDKILLSLERRMHCAGLGTCQHCAVGELYVCKDGPVFTYSQVKNNLQYK